MADVVAEADVLPEPLFDRRIRCGLPQSVEEIDCFGSRFEEAERFGFDSEADEFSRFAVEAFQELRDLDQVADDLRVELIRLAMSLEPEGEGGDAAFALLGETIRENGCTVAGVTESFGGGPVGEIDLILDPLGVEISVGEGVESVADQAQVGELIGKPLGSGLRIEDFADDGFGEP